MLVDKYIDIRQQKIDLMNHIAIKNIAAADSIEHIINYYIVQESECIEAIVYRGSHKLFLLFVVSHSLDLLGVGIAERDESYNDNYVYGLLSNHIK